MSQLSAPSDRTRTDPADNSDKNDYIPQYNESNLIFLKRHEHLQKSMRILSFASYILQDRL